MTILGDLVSDALSNLVVFGRTDKKLDRLMREGELLPATIYGIRLRPNSDGGDEWVYGLDLQTTTGALRVAVRQQLLKEPERASLGATVMVRHAAGQVAIDWPATLERAGVPDPEARSYRTRQLKEPIAPGIDDRGLDRGRLERGTRLEARVERVEPKLAFGMPTDALRLALTVLDPSGDRHAELGHVNVPAYARSLVRAGAVLPVAVDPARPDRITVDWATAGERAA